jgi:hypothetical protein
VLALREEREGSISSVICFLQADVEKNGTKEPTQISEKWLVRVKIYPDRRSSLLQLPRSSLHTSEMALQQAYFMYCIQWETWFGS